MRVIANNIGLYVVSLDGSRNAIATQAIKNDGQVTLSELAAPSTLQPLLRLTVRGRELRHDTILGVRFALQFQGRRVWSGYQPQPYSQPQSDFLPNQRLIDLAPYRGALLGEWKVTASFCAFRSGLITGLPPAAVRSYIEDLDYVEIASLLWNIIPRRESLLSSSGEFRDRIDPERLQQVEVSISDI